MTNSVTEFNNGSGGTVTLRGIAVPLDGDVARVFVTDCVRFIEGLLTEEQLRKKYQLDDAGWQQLAANEPLQQRVGAEKEKRIRDGSAAREKAAHLFIAAPAVLGGIMNDAAASARHRIEACRELRQVALPAAETNTQAGERIVINLNFGTHKVYRNVELKPIEREPLTIEPGMFRSRGPRRWPTAAAIVTLRTASRPWMTRWLTRSTSHCSTAPQGLRSYCIGRDDAKGAMRTAERRLQRIYR
jgi:hypothetical protein